MASHSCIFKVNTVVCCGVRALGQTGLGPNTMDIVILNRAGTLTKGSKAVCSSTWIRNTELSRELSIKASRIMIYLFIVSNTQLFTIKE